MAQFKVRLGYYSFRDLTIEAADENEATELAQEHWGDNLSYGEQTEIINNLTCDGTYGVEQVGE